MIGAASNIFNKTVKNPPNKQMKYFKCLIPFEENSSTIIYEVETQTKIPEEILSIIPSIKNPDLEKTYHYNSNQCKNIESNIF